MFDLYKGKYLGLLILVALLVSSFTGVIVRNYSIDSKSNKHSNTVSSMPKILIIHDSYNPIIASSSNRLRFLLRTAYPYVDIRGVASASEFYDALCGDYAIYIIYFNSTPTGIKIGASKISWHDFNLLFEDNTDKEFIILTGNTYKLDNKDTTHYVECEKHSTTALEIYAIWETAVILESHLGEDSHPVQKLKSIAAKYYLENFDQLIDDSVAPTASVGSADQDYRAKKLREYLEKHPASLKVQINKRNPASSDIPVIAVKSYYRDPDSLIDYLPFPSVSGLAGSIGDFIDKIIDFLKSNNFDILGIPTDVVSDLIETFEKIYDFIGHPENLGDGSKILEFMRSLLPEFPYLENYTKYFDLFVNGFFALKGNLSSIINFFTTAIDIFFPEDSTLSDIISQLKEIANTILNIPQNILDFYEGITSNKISIIASYIMKYAMNFTSQLLMKAIPSENNETIISALNYLLTILTDEFLLGNTTNLVDRLLDLPNKINIFSSDITDALNKLGKIIGLTINYLEKNTEEKLRELIEEAVSTLIPQDEISNLTALINDIIGTLDEIIKKGNSDPTYILNRIMDVLNNYVEDTPETQTAKQIIRDALTIIAGVSVPEFDFTQVTSLMGIIKNILEHYISIPEDYQKIFQIINATMIPLSLLNSPSRLIKAFFGTMNPIENAKDLVIDKIVDALGLIISEIDSSINIDNYITLIRNATKLIGGITDFISQIKDRPFDALSTGLILITSFTQFELFDDLNITQMLTFIEGVLPDIMGMVRTPSLEEAKSLILNILGALSDNDTIKNTITTIMEFIFDIRDAVRGGIKWLTTKIFDWAEGYLLDFLNNLGSQLEDVLKKFSFLNISGDINLKLAGMDSLSFSYSIIVDAGIKIRLDNMAKQILDVLFKGKELSLGTLTSGFKQILSFITITPIFQGQVKLKAMFRQNDDILSFILDQLGVDIKIEGEARFKLKLFAFELGSLDLNQFMDLEEWYLSFSVEVSKTFSIFDLLGVPEINSVAEWLGIEATVTISLGFKLEITLGSQSSKNGDKSVLTAEITVAGTLHIGLDVEIAEVSLDATLSIKFSFKVDTSLINPLTFRIIAEYSLKIHAEFLFVGKTWKWSGKLIDYTFPEQNEKPTTYAGGFDQDSDGLPDTYENSTFGFAVNRSDTDGDGLYDSEEMNTYFTDPLDPDTDGDGLSDYEEVITYSTDPLNMDTDGDRLNDYEEVIIYNTNPHEVDTDSDGLDDNFEVNYRWDISSITISIAGVNIGGETYYDHTDPLNPDTDGDGLLDGQEGPLGGYYADAAYAFDPDPNSEPNPIIFNYGYTHPLDNDTDDDSYKQLPDGSILEPKVFLRSMTDKEEIEGITVVFIDPDEGPVLRTFRTNPVCPDTDMDTGSSSVLLSDGYELALNPPSDPLDGDTDDDGLIDGDEGASSPISNKTDRNNPDTDNDGLGDLQEIILGLDPTRPDTDGDLVSDGDEFLKYGTDPHRRDSDNDLLNDGEELFYWHSNPLLKDSDNDGIPDGEEVLFYFTNPMDEDSDNDNLTDREELFIYNTIPLAADSDGDNIWDGDEVFIYHTNPLNWDSDNDTIYYRNDTGDYTWPMSDYDEIFRYNTNPLESDTDKDGIPDGFETYIALGNIPGFNNIALDASDNDTDDDGILDGYELALVNVSSIIYPYVAYYIIYPMNSSPVLNDTDNDGVDDYTEIYIYNSNANMTDSDGDGLDDYEEIFERGTNPAYWDTDHDNISDYDEVHNTSTLFRLYNTDPLNPDTDGDLLPDGYEIQVLHTNPTQADSDGDGVDDGLEIDSDDDMLSDGLEFYVYNTTLYPGGGIYNPDSDMDGLSDGAEVYIHNTNATNPDTDGDGILDGAEVAVGTDPLEYTSWEEYQEAILALLGNQLIRILTPRGSVIDKYIDVRVINGTTLSAVWFMYNRSDGYVSENITMEYDNTSLQWVYSNTSWEEGNYTITVYGLLPNGTIIKTQDTFTVVPKEVSPPPEKEENIYVWLLIGLFIGVVAAVLILNYRRVMDLINKVIEKRKRSFSEEQEADSNLGGENNEG